MVNKTIQLDFTKEGLRENVEAVQGDTGRTLLCTITGVNMAGVSARFYAVKKSGKEIYNNCPVSGNKVTINLTEQTLAETGVVKCQLDLRKGSQKVQSFIFDIEVTPSLMAQSEYLSSNEYKVVDDLAEKVETNENKIAELDNKKANKDDYGSPLTANTISEMTDKKKVYVYTGSESGYTAGNWYSWNGTAWVPGGVYNSAAIQTDKTLTQSGKAADSAIVGQQIGSLKESLKNVAVTDGSITTSKIADKAVTGDKIDFIDKKEFHFYTPTGDANAENASANNRNYMIPFEVGTPYIYMIMQTRLQGRQFGSVNAPYKSGINNWSIYGYDVSRAIGTAKDKTVQLWFYPEKASSSNYPWTECRKFDCSELNQYFEKSKLSGTQTIYCEVHKESCGWFGVDNDTWANKDKLSILWLKEEPTLNDWLNGFKTVETLNKNVEANFLKMRDALGMYHNVLDYGITQDADDNSLKFQQMVDELSQNGGGTIYVPIGTYKFDTSNGQYIEGTGGCKCCIKAKNNVSIVGESLTDSVFKMTGHSSQGVCMFGYNSAANKTPIEGCTYRNFTVNGEECTIDTYSSDGKAFFYQYVKNCVWRDLRLIGTPATSLGIDFLDNVVIDSIYCYESGRIHADNSPGGAGVGIGTGAWENENFIVRNCICDNCGHFGIFLEDQHIFGDAAHRTPTYPKGVIIANNICRNGRNYGFGVRGGQHVIFDGNEAYENANGGFFSDYQNKSIVIQNNLIRDNTGNGICLGNEKPGILETSFENVTIKDNVVIGNKTGINIGQKTTNLNLIDNIVRDNTVKDITVSATQTSCYISGNLVLTADVSNYLNKVENSEL
jgi:hypothetical protein